MTVVQPPRHRAPTGAQGFGHEPHPSGPITVAPRRSRHGAQAADVATDAPTVPIARAALDAARAAAPAPAPMPMPMAAPMAPLAPMAAPVAPRNGLGIAGLVLGLCGLVVGLIPLFGIGAILLGVVGLVLGLVGVTRARKRLATNTRPRPPAWSPPSSRWRSASGAS
ncbi:hypothetical protein Acsp06_21300 [Actinomycetospora sp. NBRC 106375]|uniref:hypothetical protein n=1 Tax=Actinomycetospora sp. NBRC 106375 TaxID=3032207 RepID=UPI0024A06094|nr:hypothetical protein [Actinomycetospora sp. NBRC 106375]GLZ45945.1 hypothetical protein Acsp06_21300 [Actinomycetospora sp. NBRC 106375]